MDKGCRNKIKLPNIEAKLFTSPQSWSIHIKYSANCIEPNVKQNIAIVLSYLFPFINKRYERENETKRVVIDDSALKHI